jgi:hypothetical protein
MEYTLFTNGTRESMEAARMLGEAAVPVRVVRQERPDCRQPALLGPAGAFYGKAEISTFVAKFAGAKPANGSRAHHS